MPEQITLKKMAELVGFSRARFYQLVGIVFPKPKYKENNRPYYDKDLQDQCLQIKESGIGINGQEFLSYERHYPQQPEELKTCTKCNRDLPQLQFYIKKGKISQPCKDCKNQESQLYYQNNKDKCKKLVQNWRGNNKQRILDYRNLKRYGVTKEQCDRACEEQQGRCAICKIQTSLQIDHSHYTLDFRGLLCPDCNKGLGLFKDNISNLLSAISYLQKHHAKIITGATNEHIQLDQAAVERQVT